MKWTVLSDNRTSNSLLEAEHGLSILLETSKYQILLDTGASNLFFRNAEQLGISLSTVDYVFISHGHSDHAGGLCSLLSINENAKVIISPESLIGNFYSERKGLHSITTEWPQIPPKQLLAIEHNSEIASNMHIIAHIPQIHPIPKGNRHLFKKNKEGNLIPDNFSHELALYAEGLLFTGCAHSGLENILAACPWQVNTVVGGFHLLDDNESEEELIALSKRLIERYPHTHFYTSHCTGNSVFTTMQLVMGKRLHAFSVGTTNET